jgi:uncharacterized repeat protein (TIGR01451 family)
VTCPQDTLAVGESMLCTATYAVTQADIDAGSVYNLAEADSNESDPDTDDHTEDLPQNPAIDIVKTGTFDAGADGYANPGELITYLFQVSNDGNVTLNNVMVTDPLPGLSAISCPQTVLVVDESMSCSATYAVTQADIDAGSVYNEATADSDESGPDTDDNDEPLPQNPALSVAKSLTGNADEDGSGTVSLGDTLSYSIVATNNGNVTLTNVMVSDDLTGDTTACASVAPGDTCVLNVTYVVTQGDVDGGNIHNVGTADSDQTPPEEDPEDVPVPQDPSIAITKTPDVQTVVSGATATFDIHVTNDGNVTLYNVTITDPLAPDCDRTFASLAPGAGQSYQCTVIVAADLTNVATVRGNDPNGDPVTDDDDAWVDATPTIAITKTAGSVSVPPSGGYVEFTVAVKNTSGEEFTITSIVDDVYGGILDPSNPNIVGTTCARVTIQPDDTYTCVFTVFVAGGYVGEVLTDEVIVTGEDDEGNEAEDSDTADVTVAEGDGVGTPGYWKNQGSVLIPSTVLIGDWNQNGTCDAWESCIELTKEQALYLLESSNYNDGKDKRYTLARSLVAAWLNVSVADNDFVCIEAAINDGIAWLYKYDLPPIPGDHPMEGNKPIKGKTWSRTGEPIYLALDAYNNTGGGCAIDRDSGTR